MRTRCTSCPWPVACDANIEPEGFRQHSCYTDRYMAIKTPEEGSTCRSISQDGGRVERMYVDVKVCRGSVCVVLDVEPEVYFRKGPITHRGLHGAEGCSERKWWASSMWKRNKARPRTIGVSKKRHWVKKDPRRHYKEE